MKTYITMGRYTYYLSLSSPKRNGCPKGLCYGNCDPCDYFKVGDRVVIIGNGTLYQLNKVFTIDQITSQCAYGRINPENNSESRWGKFFQNIAKYYDDKNDIEAWEDEHP